MSETALPLDAPDPLLDFLEDRLRSPMLRDPLLAPLREFLERPCKKLRARLVQACFALAGGRGQVPPQLPLALELLHAGSLIIDDLEDGSLERRGAPALHVARGIPVAINSGNWLYFAALELLDGLPHPRLLSRRAHAHLALCHEGQALDLGVKASKLPQGQAMRFARAISERKTGGLSALAASLAAICADAPAPVEDALREFGMQLGVALQILDDCSSVSVPSREGKAREDLRNDRVTWVWALLGESLSREEYAPLLHRRDPLELRQLLQDRGQRLARQTLDDALASLERAVGPAPDARALARALEQSYG